MLGVNHHIQYKPFPVRSSIVGLLNWTSEKWKQLGTKELLLKPSISQSIPGPVHWVITNRPIKFPEAVGKVRGVRILMSQSSAQKGIEYDGLSTKLITALNASTFVAFIEFVCMEWAVIGYLQRWKNSIPVWSPAGRGRLWKRLFDALPEFYHPIFGAEG